MGCTFDYKTLMKSRRINADVAFHSMSSLWLKGIPVSDSKKLAICNATDPDYIERNTNAIEFEIQYLEALLSTFA